MWIPTTRFVTKLSRCFILGTFCLSGLGKAFGEATDAAGLNGANLSETPVAAITLAESIALALERNPDLAAFSWDIRAAEARQIQARLRPNPELSLEIEDVRLGNGPGARAIDKTLAWTPSGLSGQVERSKESGSLSGFRESEITLSLSQLIELGGKRANRMQLAARDRDVSAWDYEVARADVLKNVAQAFVAVLAAQQRVALDTELVQLAEQVFNTVSARVSAGRVSPLEATRAKTALSTAQVQANSSRRSLDAARSTLAASWGDKEAQFERAEGTLDEVRPIPPLEELRGRVEQNPDLARWRAEIEKRQYAIALERSKAIPDITVIAGFRTRGTPETDANSFGFGTDGLSISRGSTRSDSRWENSVVLGLSVPLPLFNRNQGSILETQHLASKASEQRRATNVQANARLTSGYQNLATSYDTVTSLREDILPAATQTFEAVNQAYRQGKLGYLDVLDAQHTLFQARQQYLDALALYHVSVAEIERTIGESIWKTDAANPSPHEEK